MLRVRVSSSTHPWHSIRSASQLSQSQIDDRPVKPLSILSRKSNRTQSRSHRNSETEQKSPEALVGAATSTPRVSLQRATSLVSTRSAERRDHAARKWFTGVRELDIEKVDKPEALKPLPRKERSGLESPKHHEMRPRTDLNALFTSATAHSATSLRVQAKRELGGDYTSYLPGGYADPHRLPVDYARLFLGRNKHISLNAQTGALNIIEGAIRGKKTRPTT